MKTTRCAVLTPSNKRADKLGELIHSTCDYTIFNAEQIEQSKSSFVTASRAAAVLANRYDGIDFPGDECRLLIVDGMARAVNLQEKFIMSRMGAAILLNDRMMTRVVQAFGRCTRSATDYSCVVVLGSEVLNLLQRRDKRAVLHPELQAEIEFGLEQSSARDEETYTGYLQAFIDQDTSPEWQDNGETAIQGLRTDASQVPVEGAAELNAGVRFEIEYQDRMWAGDYEGALDSARRVLAALNGNGLKGYKGLWSYLAGSSAHLANHYDGRDLTDVSKDFFWSALRETSGITWLKTLSRFAGRRGDESDEGIPDDALFERMESVIERIGIGSDTKLVKIEKDIREGLAQPKSGPFEKAHESLGELLGFKSGNKETPGAPDPWWIVDQKLCLIFEDHSNATSGSLDVSKARQVSSHPKWVRDNLELDNDATVIPILISPVKLADVDALPHLDGVAFWPLDEFRSWSERALAAFREARNIYPGTPGDLAWRAEAKAAMGRNKVDLKTLVEMLRKRDAKKALTLRSP
jgi:Helicase C-terminal domain